MRKARSVAVGNLCCLRVTAYLPVPTTGGLLSSNVDNYFLCSVTSSETSKFLGKTTTSVLPFPPRVPLLQVWVDRIISILVLVVNRRRAVSCTSCLGQHPRCCGRPGLIHIRARYTVHVTYVYTGACHKCHLFAVQFTPWTRSAPDSARALQTVIPASIHPFTNSLHCWMMQRPNGEHRGVFSMYCITVRLDTYGCHWLRLSSSSTAAMQIAAHAQSGEPPWQPQGWHLLEKESQSGHDHHDPAAKEHTQEKHGCQLGSRLS